MGEELCNTTELLRAVIPDTDASVMASKWGKMEVKEKAPNLERHASRSLLLEPSFCLPGTTCPSAT